MIVVFLSLLIGSDEIFSGSVTSSINDNILNVWFPYKFGNKALRKVLKRLQYPLEVMLTCMEWYVAYSLRLRHVEEMMRERGVFVDHAILHLWATKMGPVLAAVFRRRKHPVGKSWRIDVTYINVAGEWKYLYRAIDRAGNK